jgi:hypothetical protein
MSWSMFSFGTHWAHAHDIEQTNFMALASEFAQISEKYKQVPWLQAWRSYWLEHMGSHGNGCSDLGPDEFLTDAPRVEVFKAFLLEYAAWLSAFGAEIPVAHINKLLEHSGTKYQHSLEVGTQLKFAQTIEAVLSGNEQNSNVHRVGHSAA